VGLKPPEYFWWSITRFHQWEKPHK